MKLKRLSPIIVIMLIFLTGISQVLAYTSNTITYPASYLMNNPINNVLEHQSGKYVVAFEDITNSRVVVKIYSSVDGLLLSTQYINNPANWYKLQTKIKIVNVNATAFGVAIVDYVTLVGYRYCYFYVMNVESYIVNTYAVNLLTATGLDVINDMASVVYNGAIYFVVVAGDGSGTAAQNFIHIVKYIISTHVISEPIQADINSIVDDTTPELDGGLVLAVQGTNTKDLYILFDHDNSGQPFYYRFDLSSLASEYLGRNPNPNRYSNQDRLLNIGCDVYDNDEASPTHYLYLYFTWNMPKIVGGFLAYTVVQNRLRFNNTITTANLLNQNERTGTFYPDIAEETPSWTLGYMANKSSMVLYNPNYTSGTYYVEKATYNIPDWFNMGLTTITQGTLSTSTDIPFNIQGLTNILAVQELIARNLTSQWQFNTLNYGYVLFNVAPQYYNYDILLSYTPYETPLYIYKNYEFTLQTRRNGIDTPLTYEVIINGIGQGVGVTDWQGIAQQSRMESISGWYNWEIHIYDSGEDYEETFNILYQTTDLPSQDPTTVLMPSMISLMLNMIPIGVIGLCGMMFGKMGGYFGFITGIALGTIICFLGGLIPIWALLIIIICVIGLIIFRPSSGG